MKKLVAILLTGFITLSFTACGQKSSSKPSSNLNPVQNESENTTATITISHKLETIEVPSNPKKVAVLDLAVLDILDALGLGERVVGVPKKSQVSYLISYNENKEIKNLGSLKEVDMETLNSLEPDVIFIGGRLESEYKNLSRIAPTVFSNIENENGYMNELKENVRMVASIFGKEKEAEELLNSFDIRIKALNEAASDKTAMIGLVTSSSFNTLGDNARCSMISNEIGFKNLANDINSTHGDTSSFELLLNKNPDYIFVLDRDSAINTEGAKLAKEIMENEIVMKTNAYQNGNIVYLTPDVWYLAEGGITATDTMVKDLENAVLNKN